MIDAKFSLSESKKVGDQSPIENLQKYLENVLNENVNLTSQISTETESPVSCDDLKGQENGPDHQSPREPFENGLDERKASDSEHEKSCQEIDLKNSENDLRGQPNTSLDNNNVDPAQSDALKP